jgi:hypothetical protein
VPHTAGIAVEPPGGTRLFVQENDQLEELVIQARAYSDDHIATVAFVANDWFVQARTDELLKLAFVGFRHDYAADEVALYFGERNQDVKALFDYVHTLNRSRDMGFECEVAPEDAWKYLRAFRYPVFVQAACEECFGALLHEQGWGVFPREDASGGFYARTPEATYDRDTEAEAWAALGAQLEPMLAQEAVFRDVVAVRPGSGIARPVVAPARSVVGRCLADGTSEPLLLLDGPLKASELARITDHGQHALDVVVPVDLHALIDSDIEWLNDEVFERITGSVADLTGLSYALYRGPWPRELGAVEVLLRVTADWEPLFDEDDPETRAS